MTTFDLESLVVDGINYTPWLSPDLTDSTRDYPSELGALLIYTVGETGFYGETITLDDFELSMVFWSQDAPFCAITHTANNVVGVPFIAWTATHRFTGRCIVVSMRLVSCGVAVRLAATLPVIRKEINK